MARESTHRRAVATAPTKGRGSLGEDAFVVLVECVVLLPALLLSAAVPLLPLASGIVLTALAVWWPVDAGNVPRIVTGLTALLAFAAAVLGLLS